MTERFEVQRAIAAPPSAIFSVLRDPAGHVAIDSSGMLMSATGTPATAVGDEFVVHMDREALNDYPLGLYDVTVKIVTFEQDREIAWTILGQLQPPIGHVYGYRLEPIDAGTMATPSPLDTRLTTVCICIASCATRREKPARAASPATIS